MHVGKRRGVDLDRLAELVRAPIDDLDQAPYAGRIAPLMGAAAGLTKKATTMAIASGATACANTSTPQGQGPWSP
jgi:hypothetical protein